MFRFLLITLVASSAAWADGEFRVCQDGAQGTQVIFVDAGEKSPLLALFRNDTGKAVDFVEADGCEKKEVLSEELLQNIAELDNVVGACFSITNNAGDGTLAILRQTKASVFEAEVKTIEVEKPNKARGKSLRCG